jgi:hypothetical protein
MLPERRPFAGWAGTTCVVTGGLGFIGCNLSRALVHAGATVRVVDALVPGHGGRRDHLDDVAVESVMLPSVADPGVADLIDGADVVFNIAGQVSPTTCASSEPSIVTGSGKSWPSGAWRRRSTIRSPSPSSRPTERASAPPARKPKHGQPNA